MERTAHAWPFRDFCRGSQPISAEKSAMQGSNGGWKRSAGDHEDEPASKANSMRNCEFTGGNNVFNADVVLWFWGSILSPLY